MKRTVLSGFIVVLGLFISGCSQLSVRPQQSVAADVPDVLASNTVARPRPRPSGGPVAQTAQGRVPENARTVEQFDTTTAEERATATGKATGGAGEKRLGSTIASLGDPAQGGFWLKTPLVETAGTGRLQYPANGKSVRVDLIPIDGPKTGGSRISLAAIRALGTPLTGLPELVVYAR